MVDFYRLAVTARVDLCSIGKCSGGREKSQTEPVVFDPVTAPCVSNAAER